MMDRKKEAFIIALAEKGKTYREIAKEAKVSPNTIKAILIAHFFFVVFYVQTLNYH